VRKKNHEPEVDANTTNRWAATKETRRLQEEEDLWKEVFLNTINSMVITGSTDEKFIVEVSVDIANTAREAFHEHLDSKMQYTNRR